MSEFRTLIGRLFDRAYGKNMAEAANHVLDQDIADLLRIMQRWRRALMICQDQFQTFADEHRAKVGNYATLVENQEIERLIQRDQGIADSIKAVLEEAVLPRESRWLDIATAPQNGMTVLLLGKYFNGRPYVQTGRWANIKWSVEETTVNGPPTHWQPVEDLPDGY